MINLKEKVSEETEEGKRLKVRLGCARLELVKTYKVTLDGARVKIPAQLPTFRHNLSSLMWLLVLKLTVPDLSYVRLASSVEQASEHKFKSIGFQFHVRLTLCLEHVQYIYTIYIHWIWIYNWITESDIRYLWKLEFPLSSFLICLLALAF